MVTLVSYLAYFCVVQRIKRCALTRVDPFSFPENIRNDLTWFENNTDNTITANRSGCKGQNDLKIQEKVKVWWSNLDLVTSKIPGFIQGEDLQMQEVIVEEGVDDLAT